MKEGIGPKLFEIFKKHNANAKSAQDKIRRKELGEAIGRSDYKTIKTFFLSESVDTDQLFRISKLLNFDFIEFLKEHYKE